MKTWEIADESVQQTYYVLERACSSKGTNALNCLWKIRLVLIACSTVGIALRIIPSFLNGTSQKAGLTPLTSLTDSLDYKRTQIFDAGFAQGYHVGAMPSLFFPPTHVLPVLRAISARIHMRPARGLRWEITEERPKLSEKTTSREKLRTGQSLNKVVSSLYR